ncbi:hypothetical protein HF682_00215 [Leeia sp. IMCC25680]|uniref:Uncharacterized protein n=2 Tax=Leeia aquatica TaxID=2725557 RepID=A0A847S4B0_9NEIS|nr:hypothetical protein [Leeia aquatica]
MFEQTTLTISRWLYGLTITSCAVWLAWLCFAHLPLWGALFLLPVLCMLAAMVGAPLLAAASLLAGTMGALLMLMVRRWTASPRSGA